MYINLTSGIMKKTNKFIKGNIYQDTFGFMATGFLKPTKFKFIEKTENGNLFKIIDNAESYIAELNGTILFSYCTDFYETEESEPKLSDCCGVELVPDCDICPKCKEHC